jgi:Fe-S cluster assembly protein SufD
MTTWLEERRRAASDANATLPVPTIKDEHWRYTNLRGIDFEAFTTPKPPASTTPTTTTMLVFGEEAGRVVQCDGAVITATLDAALAAQGVVFASLETAAETHAAIVERHLGSLVATTDKFAAENAATWTGGVLLYVPAGVTITQPLHAAFEIAAAGSAQQWRVLVVVEADSQVTFVEEHAPGVAGYANGVVELIVGDGARVEYVTVQHRHPGTLHFGYHRARVGRDAQLDWVAVALGAATGKTRMESQLAGAGSTVRLTGAYVLDGDQHVDLDTTQEHDAPHASSDLFFKGVLQDRSRAVWRGVIRVAEGAQRTDAYQENRNLLLSDRAHADSIPGLEIKANDVRCTHGATIGRVDADQLFYLESRGLERAVAERLIVEGFFMDALARIATEPVRTAITSALLTKLR